MGIAFAVWEESAATMSSKFINITLQLEVLHSLVWISNLVSKLEIFLVILYYCL